MTTQTLFADHPVPHTSSLPAATHSQPAVVPDHIKSPSAFRTISEVATELEVPQHVLRFWESKFPQIRPLKRGGGRRYYRPEDISLLKQIQNLLYSQGYTIKGVQKVLRDTHRTTAPAIQRISQQTHSATPVSAEEAVTHAFEVLVPARSNALPTEIRRELETILGELKSLRELLKQSGI